MLGQQDEYKCPRRKKSTMYTRDWRMKKQEVLSLTIAVATSYYPYHGSHRSKSKSNSKSNSKGKAGDTRTKRKDIAVTTIASLLLLYTIEWDGTQSNNNWHCYYPLDCRIARIERRNCILCVHKRNTHWGSERNGERRNTIDSTQQETKAVLEWTLYCFCSNIASRDHIWLSTERHSHILNFKSS